MFILIFSIITPLSLGVYSQKHMEEDIAISQFQILGVISLIILGFELIALISMSRRYIPTGSFEELTNLAYTN